MNWLTKLIRAFLQAFLPSRDKAERERKTLDKETGRPIIEVSLYQTEDLSSVRGRTPEKMLAKYLAQALDEAGFDYRIQYGYKETFDPPRKDNSVENYDWWADNTPKTSRASNLPLYDARGGGRASVGGNTGIVGMNRVTSLNREHTPCYSDQCGNIWAGIHELGHNLGGRHKTPMMKDKPKMLFHPNMKELLHERYDERVE